MTIQNLLDVKSRKELRDWLLRNHDKESECWIVVKRGRPVDDGTFWYIDAVEEALCFGWIDSTTKKIFDDVTAQRLCPRRPRSNWSELNKERCRRMERLGLMTDAGRAVFPDMTDAGFTIDADILREEEIRIAVPHPFRIGPDDVVAFVQFRREYQAAPEACAVSPYFLPDEYRILPVGQFNVDIVGGYIFRRVRNCIYQIAFEIDVVSGGVVGFVQVQVQLLLSQ